MAELGSSHNRWYVMGQHLNACGPVLSANDAERIALEIEIEIEGAHANFIACAEHLAGRSINEYHPLIAAVLHRYKANGGV